MSKDEQGRNWVIKRDGIYQSGDVCYSPPPEGDPLEPPPPIGASQEEIDAFDRKRSR